MSWLLIPVGLAVWVFQNILHESSHLLLGYIIESRKPLKLKFWPHKLNGRWCWSSYECGPSTKEGSESFRHSAPVIANSIYGPICLAALVLMRGSLFFALPVLASIVDMLVWVYGYLCGSEMSDGQRFKTSLKGETDA